MLKNAAAPSGPERRRTGFTLRELEVLRALVQTGKATVAARRLGMSQPAVSRALGQLEAQLGRQLFERAGNRLIPNGEALSISEQLGPVFAALSRIADRSEPEPSTHSGQLRIVAPPTIAHRFLPTRIAAFTKHNPKLDIVFDVISSDSLITSIAEGQHDVGLTDAQTAHEGIRPELLLATSGICVLPARHPLADLVTIRPEHLENENFIALTRRHSARAAVDRVFERAGVRRRVVIETATSVSAAEFVREGLGIAVMNPFPIVHQLGSGIVARPFEPSIPYRTNFLLPAGQAPSAATLAFIQATRASIEPGDGLPHETSDNDGD
ncbi:LysR substrate-binding domain-containing protein [Mangrovibrevibacter kandeliae]|uniref:LysR substrate-binding domain-containing protein n=1 Tax=Mangrovibrevibacter kandeliae TaxID=2968473 RepID=UPI0021180BC9|nr:LysR substrate-binding domain-containing protein [Aurantimonas sp. CSK15Z-1]MCQ8782074.1 LysR substrate-binding domain-containing protein [Aurantimonas sp. CSK15Z-1]